jgi:hypothetical protein
MRSFTDFLQTRIQSGDLVWDKMLTLSEAGFSPAPGFYYHDGDHIIQAGGHMMFSPHGRWYEYRVRMPWGFVYSDSLSELEAILFNN